MKKKPRSIWHIVLNVVLSVSVAGAWIGIPMWAAVDAGNVCGSHYHYMQ